MSSNDFIPLKRYCELNNKSKNSLYVMFQFDKKRGRTDRFRKIQGKLFVHRNCHTMYECEILECQQLYYECREHFDNDFSMAKYFAEKTGDKGANLNMVFRDFRFGGKDSRFVNKRKALIKAFKDFLDERISNGN